MIEDKETQDTSKKTTESLANQDRPKRGLEDWEMLQPREETPLKIPYWFVALVVVLLLSGVFLSFPLLGVRSGYERPWLDWGLLVGVGYGLVSLVFIYFFLRKSKNSKNTPKSTPTNLKNKK